MNILLLSEETVDRTFMPVTSVSTPLLLLLLSGTGLSFSNIFLKTYVGSI